MTKQRISAAVAVVCLCCAISLRAQSGPEGESNSDANGAASATVVPRLIKFSGEINPQIAQITQNKDNENGKSQSATRIAVTFSLYELQEGGSSLWSESQKVQLDEQGRYTVLLGATQADGLPLDLFTSGKALWLGVQPQLPGAVEQPRVLLVAVPYALKASDSDTLGGKPASAYALANTPLTATVPGAQPITDARQPTTDNRQPTTDNQQPVSAPQPSAPCSSVTSDGTATANSIAMFTTNCNLEASAITQTSGNIGISGASPANTKFQITDTPAADFGIHYTNHELLNSSVTKNGTNKGLTFVMDVSNMTVPTGVTDSGYRLAVLGAAYAGTAGFKGTLAAQYGVWGRAGISTATSGATVTNAYAGYFDIFNAVAGTTITNAYGVYIVNSNTTGTITNRYDLYASSANGKSYFAGNVGIGTTTPAAKLEVNGTTKFDMPVTFAAGQTFAGTGTVTSVGSGAGLAGGPVTSIGTLSIAAAGVTNSMLQNPGISLSCAGLVCDTSVALGGTLHVTSAGGTITGVTAGTDLTGGGTAGNVILNLDTTKVPVLAAANTFTMQQTVAGGLALPATGTATSGGGFNSSPLDLTASSFDSGTSAVAQDFRWVAEPVGSNTASPSATLNLQYASGGAAPAETGLTINSQGVMTFASGQTSAGTAPGGGVAAGPNGPVNPMQIALKKWYSNISELGFFVGNQPSDVVFDGANIWVANFADGTVTKLQANDGKVLGTFAAGTNPAHLAFDGANIWVTASQTGLIKLRASDGASLKTISTFDAEGVVFDGIYIWVANYANGTVTRYVALNGTNGGTFTVGNLPYALTSDGVNIWVANNGDNTVTELRAQDGACNGVVDPPSLAACTFSVGTAPIALTFDGSNIWVANNGSNSVTELQASNGATLRTVSGLSGPEPEGIVFDGANIWVSGGNDVDKIRASDGTVLGTFPGANGGLAFDGASVWATLSSANQVFKH